MRVKARLIRNAALRYINVELDLLDKSLLVPEPDNQSVIRFARLKKAKIQFRSQKTKKGRYTKKKGALTRVSKKLVILSSEWANLTSINSLATDSLEVIILRLFKVATS